MMQQLWQKSNKITMMTYQPKSNSTKFALVWIEKRVALKIIGIIKTQFGRELKLKSVGKNFQAKKENKVASVEF